MTEKTKTSADFEKEMIIYNAMHEAVSMSATCLEVIHAFTYAMQQKMEGAASVSTSVLENEFCKAHMQIDGSICQSCYAKTKLGYQKSTRIKMEKNDRLFKDNLIPWEDIPVLMPDTWEVLRFEAFGDIENETQVINYLNIARKNAHMDCALWTKNLHILDRVFETEKKPDNLEIGYSALFVDLPVTLRAVQRLHPYVDFVFNVISADYAKKNGIKANCMRSCKKCGWKCYRGGHENGEVYEIIRKDSAKAVKAGLYE